MRLRNKLISCIEKTGNYYQIFKIIVPKYEIFLSRKVHISAMNKNNVFLYNTWI